MQVADPPPTPTGSASPRCVVLVNGPLLNAEFWTRVAPRLGSDVLTIDPSADVSIPACADRLLSTSPSRFALVGHAMGGFVAFEVLRRAPERVSRLALLATTASADTATQKQRREEQMRRAESGDFDALAAERCAGLMHADRRGDAALQSAVMRMAQVTGPDGFIREQRAIMARQDSTPDLSAIACPTLVMSGRQDPLSPPEHSEALARAIPGARLEIIEDCGHLLALEQPYEVATRLAAWLSDPVMTEEARA